MISIHEITAGVLISGWITLLSLQIFGFMTPPRLNLILPGLLALVAGIAGAMAVYVYYGALWSIVVAASAGVYDTWGQVFILGLVVLEIMMGALAAWSWNKNRYIDYTH